jgi:hypothetical protein
VTVAAAGHPVQPAAGPTGPHASSLVNKHLGSFAARTADEAAALSEFR